MVLEEGQKYLSIRMDIGKAQAMIFKTIHKGEKDMDFAAFVNDKHDENPQSPKYKSDDVAIWINTKKNKEETV